MVCLVCDMTCKNIKDTDMILCHNCYHVQGHTHGNDNIDDTIGYYITGEVLKVKLGEGRSNIDYTKNIIIMENVIEKVSDPLKVLNKMKDIMRQDSRLIIKVGGMGVVDDIINKKQNRGESGTISWFNSNSMKLLCEKSGMFLNRVSSISSDYIFEVMLNDNKLRGCFYNVFDVIYDEMCKGIYDIEKYNTTDVIIR